MPLGSSSDSLVDLKSMAWAESSTNLATRPLGPLSTMTPGDTPQGGSWTDQWWEPGRDISQYERDFIDKKTSSRKAGDQSCFACFLAPWFARHNDDNDETDSDEEEEVDTLVDDSTSGGSFQGGILKRSSISVQVTPGIASSKRGSYHPKDYREDSHQSSSSLLPHHVRFTKPIGKVVDIQPFCTMAPEERNSVWWQLSDFDAFKRELSLLTKSKQLGGCEVWLGNSTDDLKEEVGKETDPKWWHKFGHSRRGLERYLSQEQQEVEIFKALAKKKVFEEQKRQRRNKDKEEEIARVYQDYTAWSRDLALAAAASDADAVASGFDDASRKTREYYLVKQAVLSGGNLNKHTPQFMVPVGLEKKPPSAYREVKKKRASRPLGKSLSKTAAGFGTRENVGTLISAVNEVTRGQG